MITHYKKNTDYRLYLNNGTTEIGTYTGSTRLNNNTTGYIFYVAGDSVLYYEFEILDSEEI